MLRERLRSSPKRSERQLGPVRVKGSVKELLNSIPTRTICQATREDGAGGLAATISIEGSNWPRTRVESLSGWLQAHAAAAAVSSITLTAQVHPPPLDTFILPSPQLTSLCSLKLSRLVVKPAAAAAAAAVDCPDTGDPQAPLPVLTQELATLTHLSFDDCLVSLKGLGTLKDLRSLALIYSPHFDIRQSLHSRNNALLAAALPSQPQLTALELHGQFCNAAVLAAAGVLPALHSLRLAGTLSAADLGELPASMTCFHLEHWQAQDVPTPSFTAATPRLCQLTALQELGLQYVGTFHPVVLAEMRDLRQLYVCCHSIDKDVAEPGLEVLTRLKRLQSVQLPVGRLEPVVATSEGIAALTSSSVLTKLGALTVPAAHFRALFPPGRLLPQLLELSLNDQIFVQHETLYTAVVNCSALTRLEVHAPCEISILQGQGVPPQATDVNRGLAQLATLQHLRALHLEWCPVTVESWQTLVSLPALKQLRVVDYDLYTANGLLEMTNCRALTNFVFELNPYRAWFGLKLQNKAPAGSHPDVWCRLPAAVNRFALDILHATDGEGPLLSPDGPAVPLFRHLAATAAADIMAFGWYPTPSKRTSSKTC